MAKLETITGPAFAACYLVNGDDSGLEAEDCAKLDAWLKREGIAHIHGTDGDSTWFTWYGRLHYPEGESDGLTVCDYIAELA